MSPELIAICKQLLKAGKPVSVGMIKSRAPKNIPLPAIVQAVQFCKTQAATVLDMEEPETAAKPETEASSERELISEMAAKIEELERRVTALESQVDL